MCGFPSFARRLSLTALFAVLVGACAVTTEREGASSPDAGASGDATGGVDAAVAPCEDPDGDGFGPNCARGAFDCRPNDPVSFPGAEERCGDSVDNNCDGRRDEQCGCTPGTIERCYEGPEGSAGVGTCVEGFTVCGEGGWGPCQGQVLPVGLEEIACDGLDEDCDGDRDEGLTNRCGECGAAPIEQCGDGLDNDCDGAIDELDAGCVCGEGLQRPCYSGPPSTLGVGDCVGGVALCEGGALGACIGEVLPVEEFCDSEDNDCDGVVDEGIRNACGQCGVPAPPELCDGLDNDCDGAVDEGVRLACGLCPGEQGVEVCGDGEDNDCDGLVDEQCGCTTGEPACYPGPSDVRGVGACTEGVRECGPTGEFWGPCEGAVFPTREVCDGVDNDCDGVVDVAPSGCSVCETPRELCDGEDNDCDGLVDEGQRDACGNCLDDPPVDLLCDGIDGDCDGLVDEGLLNGCGRCGESCFAEVWDEPAEWMEGAFDGVDADNLGDGLRLGSGRLALPDLWVSNTDDGTVTHIDTDRAEVLGTYTVGLDPSRTAVSFTGDVYVANRAFDRFGSVTKVLARGCEGDECVAWTTRFDELDTIPRGLAIDREGFPWVGTYGDGLLRRLDPDSGEVLRVVETGASIYGMAIDARGVLWMSTLSEAGLAAYDTVRDQLLGSWSLPGCTTPYGLAVDEGGNIWLGTWSCDTLVRFDRASFDAGTVRVDAFESELLRETRGVAVDGEGAIYVAASGTNRVGKFDPATESWAWTAPTCASPIGVGVARDGAIWVACKDDNAVWSYGSDGTQSAQVSVGASPYSYSDITGFQLRNFTAPSGTWTATFDCGREDCRFDRVRWSALLPDGTGAEVRVRSRLNADAEWSAWSPRFGPSPAEIAAFVPPGRVAEVEVLLSTMDRALSPIVQRVELEWQ